MLGALAGAESLEIIVLLKDMSEAGLRKLEGNVARTEARVNGANFSGFSKKTSTLAKDAEKVAGKEVKGGGGLGGMTAGLLGLPGPLLIAGAAIGGFALLAEGTIPVYEKIEKQEKALATAAKDHGIALSDLSDHVDAAITTGESYAYNADQVRAAVIKLTEAGMSLSEQQAALPHIMDLARAKNIDLAEAARMYELALMGNTRAVKDLGIALPKLTDTTKEQGKAQSKVTKDTTALHTAQHHLALVQAELKGKTHLTTVEHNKLKTAQDKVAKATKTLHDDTNKLNSVQSTGAARASRLKTLNDDLNGAVGGQAGSVTNLEKGQAKLNNAWDKFAKQIGPGLTTVLGAVVNDLADIVGWLADALGLISKLGSIHVGIGSLNTTKSGAGHGAPVPGVNTGHGFGGPQYAQGTNYVPNDGWAYLHRAEAVIPAAYNRGGGSTNHIVHVYLDGRQITASVNKRNGYALERVPPTRGR